MSSTNRPKNFKEKVFFRKLRTQIDGAAKVEHGLAQIKGVGRRFAQAVVSVAGIDPDLRIGAIGEEDLNKIEEIILNPIEHGIHNWIVNHQNDPIDGIDRHVVGNQLDIMVRRNIELKKKIKSFRGTKHRKGLKVRGQRTKLESPGGVKRAKINKAIIKLYGLMQERNVDRLTLDRKYLPEIMNKKLLEFDPTCRLKTGVEEVFIRKGIRVNYDGVFITFFKIKEKS